MNEHLLTLIIVFPFLGAITILFLPRAKSDIAKTIAAIVTGIQLWIAVQIFFNFDRANVGMQFSEHFSWIKAFSIDYVLGIDGLSLPMVLLSSLLFFIAVFTSWKIEKSKKMYFILFLILDTGLMGVYTSLNLFLILIFWGLTLLPIYLLIGIWGGSGKEKAAMKFFLFFISGSLIVLVGILTLYFKSEVHSFNIMELISNAQLSQAVQKTVFILFFVGFAFIIPILPFHSWLPHALVESPTAIGVIIAGVLVKVGTYGLFRICFPILPSAAKWFALALSIIAVINIIYGALCAMAQTDLKKLAAYFCMSQMGFVLLGMAAIGGVTSGKVNAAAIGLSGAMFHMFNHGIVTAILLILFGVIENRTHSRDISKFGGLNSQMPLYSGLIAVAFFAGVGLPGLSMFISGVFCLIGSFQVSVVRVSSILSMIGIIITAGCFLSCFQRMFLGEIAEKYKGMTDINGRELFIVIPLIILIIILGVYPIPALNLLTSTVEKLVKVLNSGAMIMIQ